MTKFLRLTIIANALAALFGLAVAHAATTYTLPQDLHWIPDRTDGAPTGAFYAFIRGKDGDKCGALFRERFPNGYVFPWHVNHSYAIYTVLQGTLVIGFDVHHAKSAEKVLTAGSVMQGLASEPHYGRAIGETIFDVYGPPCELLKPKR